MPRTYVRVHIEISPETDQHVLVVVVHGGVAGDPRRLVDKHQILCLQYNLRVERKWQNTSAST